MKFPYHVPFGLALSAGLLGLVAVLSGCTASQTAQFCAFDAAGQPIVGALVTAADPNLAPVVTLDNQVIHPAVVAACASQPAK